MEDNVTTNSNETNETQEAPTHINKMPKCYYIKNSCLEFTNHFIYNVISVYHTQNSSLLVHFAPARGAKKGVL